MEIEFEMIACGRGSAVSEFVQLTFILSILVCFATALGIENSFSQDAMHKLAN